MTYEEATALYPQNEVKIQTDETIRLMTPTEYEAFIQLQINYRPLS